MKKFRYAVGLIGLLVASHAMAQYGVWTKKGADGSWVAPRTGFTSLVLSQAEINAFRECVLPGRSGGYNSATKIVETATGKEVKLLDCEAMRAERKAEQDRLNAKK